MEEHQRAMSEPVLHILDVQVLIEEECSDRVF